MKTKSLIFSLLFLLPALCFAQDKTKVDYEKRRQEIRAQKVAFITEQLKLTPNEAQALWPLYNELEDKKTQITQDYWAVYRKMKEGQATIADVNMKRVDGMIKEGELEKEYYLKYKKVLSEEKIFNLHKAEKDFQKELLGKIQHK